MQCLVLLRCDGVRHRIDGLEIGGRKLDTLGFVRHRIDGLETK